MDLLHNKKEIVTEQYIPKSALLAGVERLACQEYNSFCDKLLDYIDTLEVKDIDLDKEIDLAEDKYHGFESLSRADIIDIAKHFFELGMSVSNKQIEEKDMNSSDCPYFSETAPVCDDGECGCFECLERIAELRKKGEEV